MKILKVNLGYKIQGWVTKCTNCGTEYSYDERDEQMYIYGDGNGGYKSIYYVRCPHCGRYSRRLR